MFHILFVYTADRRVRSVAAMACDASCQSHIGPAGGAVSVEGALQFLSTYVSTVISVQLLLYTVFQGQVEVGPGFS